MKPIRTRDRNARWRSVGDTLARNRVARWVIRGAERRRDRGRPFRRPPRAAVIRTMAWGVHFYTASGLICVAGMVALLAHNGPYAFAGTFGLMLLATAIDATDGTLARKVRVKEVLPGFDGRRLDDLVDWLTYTCVPLLLIARAEVLPPSMHAWLVVPLMASAYGFCQSSIKTDDGYFLGFPSLWNVVALFLFLLDLPPLVSLAVILVLSALTFVPSRYLYPSSRPGLLNRVSNVGAVAWMALLVVVLCRLPSVATPGHRVGDGLTRNLVWVSTLYPIYYMGASWVVTLRHWFGGRPRQALGYDPE